MRTSGWRASARGLRPINSRSQPGATRRLTISGRFTQQALGPVALDRRAHALAGHKPKAGPFIRHLALGTVAPGLQQLGRAALPDHQNDKRVGV